MVCVIETKKIQEEIIIKKSHYSYFDEFKKKQINK